MRTAAAQPKVRSRAAGGMLAVIPIVLILAGCGSSSETITAPAQVRCTTSTQVNPASFPPEGGSGTLRVTTARECAWSARAEASWIALASGASGQGDGVIAFSVAANESPASRSAALVVNDQPQQVSQQGRPCEFRLSSNQESVPAAGGERTIDVDATSPQCGWTAAANVPWIAIVSGTQGSGEGLVTFRVAPATGPPRTGSLTIAGQSVQVEQGTCSVSVSPTSVTVPAAGGQRTIGVDATSPHCGWTAAANVPWITIVSGAQGSGQGQVTFQIAPAAGPPRTGTLIIAGHTVQVQQGTGCTFSVSPAELTVPPAGGDERITVTASSPGCAWSASADAAWVTLLGAQGSGSGSFTARVAATTGPPRSATVTVEGHTVRVGQGSGCAVSINPANATVPAVGGAATVQVSAGAGCGWTASSGAPWITVASGTQGSGPGRVDLTVAANSGPARNGIVTIGGRAFAVSQASGCSYSIAPSTMNVSGFSTTSGISVETNPGCTWTAGSEAEWITLSATSGSGPGDVRFTAAANNSPARSGTVRIAGHTFTLNQASLCTYTLLPPFHDFDAGGGNGNVLVIVSGPCTWTAASTVDWIQMTAGLSGTGNGLVQFVVAPNPGGARTGFVMIAGQRYPVVQGAR